MSTSRQVSASPQIGASTPQLSTRPQDSASPPLSVQASHQVSAKPVDELELEPENSKGD